MKRVRILGFTLVLLVLLALPSILVPSGGAAKASELFPCDPTPTAFRKCALAGGTFDFVACKCVFP